MIPTKFVFLHIKKLTLKFEEVNVNSIVTAFSVESSERKIKSKKLFREILQSSFTRFSFFLMSKCLLALVFHRTATGRDAQEVIAPGLVGVVSYLMEGNQLIGKSVWRILRNILIWKSDGIVVERTLS
jgi:hypothetical protein